MTKLLGVMIHNRRQMRTFVGTLLLCVLAVCRYSAKPTPARSWEPCAIPKAPLFQELFRLSPSAGWSAHENLILLASRLSHFL